MKKETPKNTDQPVKKVKNEALVKIRTKRDLTQNQMAESLFVSERQYRYFEDNVLPLPEDMEKFFSKEEIEDIKLSYLSSTPNPDAFKVDIRQILSFNNGILQLRLNKSHIDYIYRRTEILNRHQRLKDKKRELEKIDSTFCINDYDIFVIGKKRVTVDFESDELNYTFGDYDIPYVFEDENSEKKPVPPYAEKKIEKLLELSLKNAKKEDESL